jgi:hypothetical protein
MRMLVLLAALVTLCAAALVAPRAADAYTAHAGDRAADFVGRDIVGSGAVRLEDYLGRWLLFEFWSSS